MDVQNVPEGVLAQILWNGQDLVREKGEGHLCSSTEGRWEPASDGEGPVAQSTGNTVKSQNGWCIYSVRVFLNSSGGYGLMAPAGWVSLGCRCQLRPQ